MASCPQFESNNNAGALVNEGYARYSQIAQDAVLDATTFLDELKAATLELTTLPGEIEFNPALDTTTDFSEPEVPVTPEDFSYEKPDLVDPPDWETFSGALIQDPDFGETPTFTDASGSDVQVPSIAIPTDKPDALTATPPNEDAVPVLTDVTVPDAPEITIPDVPTLREVTLPDPITITLPEWTGERPTSAPTAPTGTFSWSEEGYSSSLLTEITNKISTMLAGSNGLPATVWNLIWDRATRGLAEQRNAAIQEAMERWASRGFSAPGGALNTQVSRAEAQFFNLSAEQLRDTAIKHAEQEFQALQFAISQGAAVEGQLMNLYSQIAGRSLEAAKAVFEIANSVFAAKVQLYNAQVQAYVSEANVHKTLIDAELARLEQYKVELEGQKLIGDLNQQDVQVYAARIEAVTKTIDVFRAQVDGVKAQVDVDRSRVDAYTALVGAYAEQVKAKSAEYQMYETEIRAEVAKLEPYKVQADVFATRVQAYKTSADVEKMRADYELQKFEHAIKKWEIGFERFKVELQSEMARLETMAKVFDSDIKRYTGQADVEKTKLEHQRESNKLTIEEARIASELDFKRTDQEINQAMRILVLQQESMKAIAQAQSQLAASALSAVNISAQMGDSVSVGFSQSSNCTKTIVE